MKIRVLGMQLRWLLLAMSMIGLSGELLGQEGPDRQVTLKSVSPTLLASGDELEISVGFSNQGTQSSDQTNLRYYVSTDSTISITDFVILTLGVPEMSPGTTFNSVNSAEVIQPPGTYWIGACFDEDAADIDPSNDCSASIEITIPDVDLVTLTVTPSSNRFPTGTSISLSTAVDNRGSETANPSILRYKVSNNSSITSGDPDISTSAIPALEGGERWLNESQGVVDTTPGTWWVGACADVVPGELSESNNCSGGVEIEVLSDTLPDLVVSEVNAIPNNWNPGEFIDFFGRVSNQGTASSAATSVNFFISADSTISESDAFLGADNVPAINASQTVDTGIFPDPQLTPGNYWFGACVVTDGVEFITDNNCSTGVPVTVLENTNTCTNLPISCGGTVSSDLASTDCDDSPRGTGYLAKKHTFEGGTGDEIIINADWSGDGYLYLEDPSGAVVAENDDDGDNVLSSRISHTLAATGTWTIWTTTFDTARQMSFDLALACGSLELIFSEGFEDLP
jgi:hypothetical protein